MFNLKEIVQVTGGRLEGTNQASIYNGVSINSRTIKRGELFVAIRGKRFDGHDFIKQALEQGAGAVVAGQGVKLKGVSDRIIRVPDTLISLGQLACYHRLRFNIPVIAVTGSNGKTTTKDIIYHILSGTEYVLKNEGTENNAIGVPLTLFKLKAKHKAAVVEMGSNHPGEIAQLCRIARPTIGVITNVGPSHLEFFKTQEAVAREKLSLLSYLKKGVVILNSNNIRIEDKGRTFRVLGKKIKNVTAPRMIKKIINYGAGEDACFQAQDIHTDLYKTSFVLRVKKRGQSEVKHQVKLAVPGSHSVFNALAGFVTARVLGLSSRTILSRLKIFKQHQMRLYPRKIKELLIVDDTYNANPASAQTALKWLSGLKTKKRKIFVCADMLELGEKSADYHEALGRLAAGLNIDFLISYGARAKMIVCGAQEAGMDTHKVKSYLRPQPAVKYLAGLARPGDILVFKGSRSMQMERLKECFITSYTP